MKFYPTLTYYGADLDEIAQAARELGIIFLAVDSWAIEHLSDNPRNFSEGNADYLFLLECESSLDCADRLRRLRARITELARENA